MARVRPLAETRPGETLDAPFTESDLSGATRGGDGVWDRGAFEFVQ